MVNFINNQVYLFRYQNIILMIVDINHKVFDAVSKIITAENRQAFVIGGYVRDLLLKKTSKDIDIVTVGSGIELAQKTAAMLGKHIKVTVFKNFGTAMFNYNNVEVEFVGARRESYQRGSRNPIVEDGTIEDDQKRRDFTINALAIDLHRERFGQLVDPFNGLADMQKKIIRTPLNPDITYSDDPLRMLRAIRFACRLGFTIEPESLQAIERNSQRLEIISGERIIDEFNKILLSNNAVNGIKLLDNTGLLKQFLPELIELKGVDDFDGIKHKDNYYHTLEVLNNLCNTTDDLWLRWAALLHDIGKPRTKRFTKGIGWTFHGHEFVGSKMVSGIFKKLKLPLNDKLKFVEKMVLLHMRPIVLAQDEVTDSAIRRLLFDAGDDIDQLMLLCDADITSKNRQKVERYLDNYKLVRKKLKEVEEKDRIRNFQPPVSGQEIIETFNLPPCKAIGDIKCAIKDAILDGVIENNYQSAYNYMLLIAKQMGIEPVK